MKFKLVGQTEGGTPVVAGLFDIFQTCGFPSGSLTCSITRVPSGRPKSNAVCSSSSPRSTDDQSYGEPYGYR